jgi:hypothetical protein
MIQAGRLQKPWAVLSVDIPRPILRFKVKKIFDGGEGRAKTDKGFSPSSQ